MLGTSKSSMTPSYGIKGRHRGDRMALWSLSGVLRDRSDKLFRRAIVYSRIMMSYDKSSGYYDPYRPRQGNAVRGRGKRQ